MWICYKFQWHSDKIKYILACSAEFRNHYSRIQQNVPVLFAQMLTSSAVEGKVFSKLAVFHRVNKQIKQDRDAFVLSVYLTISPNTDFKQSAVQS